MKPLVYSTLICLFSASCSTPPKTEPTYAIPDWIQESRISRIETLLFEEHRDSYVWLLGTVKAPGLFKVTDNKNYTLKELITSAHGFKRGAFLSRIKVTRDQEGHRNTFEIDMTQAAIDQGSGDFRLIPGDIIFVPEIIQ